MSTSLLASPPFQTNRAAVITGPKQLEIWERPQEPEPKEGEIMVNVVASGICGSDLHRYALGNVAFESSPAGKAEAPVVLGHESAGVIVRVGPGVTELKVGQRVLLEPSNPCFKCPDCLEARHNLCKKGANCSMLGGPDGYLKQYVTLPARCGIPIPDEISWDEAACMQPLAIAVHSARRSGIKAHQNVVVVGAGPVGLFVMAVAKAYGAKTVLAVDVSAERLKVATDLVATHSVCRSLSADDSLAAIGAEANAMIAKVGLARPGFDVVIEATGAPSCMKLGVMLARPGGVYLQVGLGARETSFPTRLVAVKELDVRGVIRYSQGSFQDALDLVGRGVVDLKPFISKRVPLTETKAAIEELSNAKVIKIVIYNNQTS